MARKTASVIQKRGFISTDKIGNDFAYGIGTPIMDYSKSKVPELKQLCKDRGISNYSLKKKNELVSMLQSYDIDPSKFQSQKKRAKAKAKANESKDLKLIIESIQTNTSAGQKLKKIFFDRFGKNIQEVRQSKGSGNNNCHIDFEILVDGVWYGVEHKGSTKCAPIDPKLPPWSQGVQFYNGIAKSYTLGNKYAQAWYTRYIASGHIGSKYNVKSQIPTFEEWYEKDVCVIGDPKTAFGSELRSKFRNEETDEGGCYDERAEMTRIFEVSEEDCETIKKEALAIAQLVLSQKNYWLQIQGDLNGEFHCAWFPELKLSQITKVTKDTKCSDVQFHFETDMGFNFRARLRWGKGQGFSNLRIDLR